MKAYYDVVIDGGAHIGCFSLFIHKRSKHVYAIEPATDNLELLSCKLAMPIILLRSESSVNMCIEV